MRMLLALLIWLLVALLWLLDCVLKMALGYLMVALVWLPFHWAGDASFGGGWRIAGGILGACLLGFCDGCDLILLGWAKRLAGDK
jgi:hypothetical protein